MNAKRTDLERIFNEAAEIEDPAARAAFLDEACAGDARLRAEILELLQHDAQAGSFLEHPPAEELRGDRAEAVWDQQPPPAEQPTLPSAPMARTAGSEPAPGTRVRYVGDYELLEEIGRGGMGVVFKARQLSLNRIVAVKMIVAGQLASPAEIERFHAEAQAAGQLQHPGIVSVHEVGEHEGQQYFSMDYVQGPNLADVLRSGPWPAPAAAELVRTLAEAVHVAHEHGILHRDLKPSNVLLEEGREPRAESREQEGTSSSWSGSSPLSALRPRPRITDFGLAKRFKADAGEAVAGQAGSGPHLTATGQVLGTPGYMAPEQAAGAKRGKLGPPADVYSLGAILYELLTGRPPFQAATPLETILQALDQDPVAPRQLNHNIPRDLETICLKCLDGEPARRYATAQELADELGRLLRDEPIRARPVGVAERGWRWLRKRGRSVAITAGAIAATAALALFAAAAWYSYAQWHSGYLVLDTDQPGLVAQLIAADGEQATSPRTLPTTEPIKLAAGRYEVRVSGEGRLAQRYHTSLARSEVLELTLNLEDQMLWPSLEIERSFRLVELNGRTDIVHLSDAGIARMDGASRKQRWVLKLDTPDDPLLQKAGIHWPWYIGRSIRGEPSGRGQFDQRPWVTGASATVRGGLGERAPGARHEPLTIGLDPEQKRRLMQQREQGRGDTPFAPATFDLNGDGADDLVIAARHEAWLLAVSGKDGQVLWVANRADSAASPRASGRPDRAWQPSRVSSAVLGPPQSVPDLDGDGAPDLIATFADVGPARGSRAARWVETLSGATGHTIWTSELDDAWFALPPGTEEPAYFRWLYQYVGSTGSAGSGASAFRGRDVVRSGSNGFGRTGDSTYVPSRIMLWQAASNSHQPTGAETRDVVLVAGRHLVRLAAATGEPAAEPIDIGLRPCREPVFADVDGDGAAELVLVERDETNIQPGSQRVAAARLLVWSVAGRRALWEKTFQAEYWQRPTPQTPRPAWPVVADIDGDGRDELLAPNGHSNFNPTQGWSGGWGTLELLDGATGKPRWNRTLKNIDPQLDRFIVGPDIDADGHREVFVATMLYTDAVLFVDCLSGKDGRTLWWSRAPLGGRQGYRSEFRLGRIRWWSVGGDGWPQLVVQVYPDGMTVNRRLDPAVYLFSSGTGRFHGAGKNVEMIDTADFDGDSVDEFVAFRPWKALDRGGMLHVVRGSTGETWRRLGRGAGQPGADFDGDRTTDVLYTGRNATVIAISGATGGMLWERHVPLAAHVPTHGLALAVLDHDLDGDGVRDVLAWTDGPQSGIRAWSPFHALSGRDGRLLWSADAPVHNSGGLAFITSRDLDGDGRPEIVAAALGDWGWPSPNSRQRFSSNDHHLGLVVLSGADGRVRWNRPLTGVDAAGELTLQPIGIGLPDRSLRATFADLDGDHVEDIVITAEVPGAVGRFELRALSGRDGTTIWSYPLPAATKHGIGLVYTAPLAADIDGDGRAEVLLLEFASARLTALEGATGQPRWKWDAGMKMESLLQGLNQLSLLPAPQLLRGGDRHRPWICVPLWSRPGQVVVLDHAGKEVWRHTMGMADTPFRVWPLDVDHDGADELLLQDGSKLQLVRPGAAAAPKGLVWEQKLPSSASQILGIQPVRDRRPAAIVVQQRTTGSVTAIHAATGEPWWSTTSPQPRWMRDPVTVEAAPLWARPADGTPPVGHAAGVPDQENQPSALIPVLFSYRLGDTVVSVCCQPKRIGSERAAVARVAARLDGGPDDPRILRDPPWATMLSDEERRALPMNVAWSAMLCGFVLVIPGWYFGRLIRRRRWSLGALLLLPLIVGLVLVALTTPAPTLDINMVATPGKRLLFSLTILPWLLFPIGLVVCAVRRQWWRVAIWLIAAVAVSAVIGGFLLVVDSGNGTTEVHYSWSCWYVVLTFGAYACGLFMIPAAAIGWFARFLRHRAADRTSLGTRPG